MVLSSMVPLFAAPLVALLQAAQPPAVPIGYDRPAMVYDARRGVVVHFGGGDNIRSTPGDTW